MTKTTDKEDSDERMEDEDERMGKTRNEEGDRQGR